jgi:nucleotide-binding universal stress UspA family protein
MSPTKQLRETTRVSVSSAARSPRVLRKVQSMLTPKLILAPIDFSDPALDAVDTAADLASRFGATLLLVHVVPALPRLPLSVSLFKEADYDGGLHDEAARRLADLSATYSQTGLSVGSEVGTADDVGMEIVRIGQEQRADLIVIANQGATGWKDLILGSVAEKVVRLARSPVLLLRTQSDHGPS